MSLAREGSLPPPTGCTPQREDAPLTQSSAGMGLFTATPADPMTATRSRPAALTHPSTHLLARPFDRVSTDACVTAGFHSPPFRCLFAPSATLVHPILATDSTKATAFNIQEMLGKLPTTQNSRERTLRR